MRTSTEDILRDAASLHEALLSQVQEIEELGRRIAGVLAAGGTLYIAGNGGSAADAQHMAGELVGRFLMESRPPLPCVALTNDSSVMTSIANDYSADEIFRKQVQALAREGDAVLGISTSGNSPNILSALEAASRAGAVPLGLAGKGGGAMREACELCLVVPHDHTPRIQEAHATIIHIWCGLIEQALFGEGRA
jgi:D-sedoheptulose 7-phosphate isomerase